MIRPAEIVRLISRGQLNRYTDGFYRRVNRMNPKVDFYFSKAKKWQEELEQLRMLVLDCGLTEELK